MGRDHKNSAKRSLRLRHKFKGPDIMVTSSLTRNKRSNDGGDNPLVDGSTPINEGNVSDLNSQLASTDPIVREHAIVAAGAIFSRPSKVAEELLERSGSLEAIIDALYVSGSGFSRVRCSAADTLSNLIGWLEEEKVVLLVNGLSLIECCLGCLIEESASLKSSSPTQIDDSMCSIQKCFELLEMLSQFNGIISSIPASFQSSGPESTIRDVAFCFAGGLPNGSLGLSSPPRSAASIMAYAAAANFISSIIRAAKQRSHDDSLTVRNSATQIFLSAYTPLISTLNEISAHGIAKTIRALSVHMQSENSERLQMNASIITLWVVYSVDAVIQLIEFVNRGKSFDSPIPNLNFSLSNCASLLLCCLSPAAYTSIAKVLRSVEDQCSSSTGNQSVPSTAENTPTARETLLLFASASCDSPSVGNFALGKGEKFEDAVEMAVVQQAEAELRLVVNQLVVSEMSLKLLDKLTDNSCLEIEVIGALDLPSAPLLTSSLESSLQQSQQSLINQQSMVDGWSIISSTLVGAMQSISNLPSQVPIFKKFPEQLWDLFNTLVDSLTALFHFCGSVLSASNAPPQCVATFQRSDLIQGPFSALLVSCKLLELLLDSVNNPPPPLSASLPLVELIEGVVHLSNEVVSRFPFPLTEPIEPSEEKAIESVVNGIGDLLQTPTQNLVQAIGTTMGKKSSSNNRSKKLMELSDDDELSEWENRQLANYINICEPIWLDIHQQLVGLNCAIGIRWRKTEILKIILSRSMLLLERKSTGLSIRAAILDTVFDMFGDEEFDSLFVELNVVQRLEDVWKRVRALMKKMTKCDGSERFQVQAATQNLQAFISYKKFHKVAS